MRRTARGIDRTGPVELVDPGGLRPCAGARIGLDDLTGPAASGGGRGIEDLLGGPVRKLRAILCDHPIRGQIDGDLRGQPLGDILPVEALHDGPVAADKGPRLVPRVAEDHRDVPRLRRGIGPERMAVQMQHVEHRPEIETAPEHRVGRLETFEQALIR